MVVDCHHVACVCGDRMKIPIFKKKNFFLKIGILFSQLGKSQLNSVGNGAEFGP